MDALAEQQQRQKVHTRQQRRQRPIVRRPLPAKQQVRQRVQPPNTAAAAPLRRITQRNSAASQAKSRIQCLFPDPG